MTPDERLWTGEIPGAGRFKGIPSNMLALLLASPVVLAAPVPVNSVVVEDRAGGSLTIQQTGKKVGLYVDDGRDSFWCFEYMRQYWGNYARLFRDLGEGVMSSPNADFGNAKAGLAALSGSEAPGYCPNVSGSTRRGEIYVSFTYNRACFGTAGCNSDVATLTFTAAQARQIAAILETLASGGDLADTADVDEDDEVSDRPAPSRTEAAVPARVAPTTAPASTAIFVAQLYTAAGREGNAVSDEDVAAVWSRLRAGTSIDALLASAKGGGAATLGASIDTILVLGGSPMVPK